MKKSFVSKYIKNKYTIISGVIILVVAIYFVFFYGTKAKQFDYTLVKIGEVAEKVSVTGKISPIQKADMAFEKSGKVVSIKVKVGERIKKGDILATLDSSVDRASLNSALAKLADITRGLNKPELALEESKINTAKVSLQNAKQEALNTSRSALTLTQTAITNYADTLFDNPQSANPIIKIRTPSQPQENAINYDRILVTDTLNKWKKDLEQNTSLDSALDLISATNSYETIVKNFMNRLSVAVNDLNPTNSGLSRTVIDTYISSMNSSLTTLNQAISSVATAKSTLENATTNYEQIYNNYLLKNSGSSAESILAQRAVVEGYRAELEKNNLISPLDGVVTRADPDVGGFVTPGTVAYTVINDNEYKIEAYVPEADIAKISIGDQASTTLDAYGQNIDFPATVVDVDPAETILEGVPTYRIILKFVYKDLRIKSGMTANLDIRTEQRQNVLVIPTRAVQSDEKGRFLRVVDETGKDFFNVPVQVGLKGSDGQTEILSGVKVGDKVVTYIK